MSSDDASSPGSLTQKSPETKTSSPTDEDATAKRAKFAQNAESQQSVDHQLSREDSKHVALERQFSRQSSILHKQHAPYRRQSSFDFPHINSVPSAPNTEKLEELDLDEVPWWTSKRFSLSIISFCGFLVLYAQRVNLSIAIVSMVDHSYLVHADHNLSVLHYNATVENTQPENITLIDQEENLKCPELEKTHLKGEFKWSKEIHGLVLGAFFWGYLILQVPGGRLSERIGAKKVIAIGMFPVAILNIISPFCARASPYLFLVVRMLVGLGEGVMYPAAQAMWANWAPPNERSRLIGFSYAGGQFGNAIIFPIGGFLCAYGFDGGWPSVFYIIGAAGFVWCVVWVIFAHDTPDQHPSISDIEKKYIKLCIGDRAGAKKIKSIPWKSIFTSKAVWSIIIAHSCGNYGAYMLLTQIPTYMKEVLKFDIKSNGVFSMLPYLMFWFFITISGLLADLIISRKLLTVAWTRKIMSSVGMLGPATFLIGTGFMECNQQSGAVVMLTVAVGLCGFHFSGYFINHSDIAPIFAGTLFGISNTAATFPGIIAPYVVSALTPEGSREQWQIAFFVAAGVYLIGDIVYIILAEGDVQKWAKYEVDADESASVGFGLHDIAEKVNEDENEDEDEVAIEGDKMLESKDESKNA